MRTTIHLHPKPGDFTVGHGGPGKYHPAYVTVDMESGDVDVAIFLGDVAKCDALIKAAVEAKRLLLGDDAPDPAAVMADPYNPGTYADQRPAPADLPAAEADPANPYGPTPLASLREREHYQAAEPVIIVPFQHLPHLPQHVGGNPMCSLCGLDHYALHAIETTGGGR